MTQRVRSLQPKLLAAAYHALGAAALLASLAAAYVTVYRPMEKRKQGDLVRIHNLEKSLVGSIEVRRENVALKEDLAKLNSCANESTQRYSTGPQETEFVTLAKHEAEALGATITEHHRGATRDLEHHCETDLLLRGTASYQQFCQLMEGLRFGPRASVVNRFAIERDQDGAQHFEIVLALLHDLAP